MTTYVIDASLSPAVAGVAAAITAQTAALVVQNELLRNAIAGLVLAVSELKDSSSGVSKSLSDINSAVGSLSVVVTQAATVAEASAASQIEINNFNKAVTIDGYQRLDMPLPKMPLSSSPRHSLRSESAGLPRISFMFSNLCSLSPPALSINCMAVAEISFVMPDSPTTDLAFTATES